MDDMTPTDKLRAMLDERGVEWEDDSPVPSMKPWKTSFTSFTGEEVTISAYDKPKWLMGTMVFHTPEQAIAATVSAEPDEATMLKLHGRMNAVLLDMNEVLVPDGHREDISTQKLIDCVIAAHQIVEDAATAGARIEEVTE